MGVHCNGAGARCWVGWAILTRQWGFVPGSLISGAVAVRNWVLWLVNPAGVESAAVTGSPDAQEIAADEVHVS
jgi:hypothetical protein